MSLKMPLGLEARPGDVGVLYDLRERSRQELELVLLFCGLQRSKRESAYSAVQNNRGTYPLADCGRDGPCASASAVAR